MKYVFLIILLAHGLIHLLGFAKAFYSTEIVKQLSGVSKPIGALWLVAFILFIITSSQFFNNKKWFYFAFAAIFISQILIVLAWKDAKFGTIANLLILVVSIVAMGNYNFSKMVENETLALQQSIDTAAKTIITQNDINRLPVSVQKWLTKSGVVGKEKVRYVHLKQVGKMKTMRNAKWMLFTAEQYFNTRNPAFIWETKVDIMPFISLNGRDKLSNGEGEMLIKLLGLIPVVNESENEKINSGTMLRFLAETCWFPQSVLNDYIEWEAINETSAKATLTINGKSVSGVFTFTLDGDFKSFEANRYYGGKKESKLEKWFIEATDYKSFNGIRIPNKCKVTWKLADGDFEWLNLEITALEHNI